MSETRSQAGGGAAQPGQKADAGSVGPADARPSARTEAVRADAVRADTARADTARADTPGANAVVRRTKDGWRVGHDDVPDLTCAMVLADLLAEDMQAGHEASSGAAGPQPAGPTADPPGRPRQDRAARPAGPDRDAAGQPDPARPKAKARPAAPDQVAASETSRLRATIGQLERALIARVRVEQAIGVLAERHRIQPRQAFEQLRAAARNRGKRVIDIATDVVASASNPLLQLPDELSRPRSAGRSRGRRGHSGIVDQGAS